jgi:N-methylhydantoinase B
LLYAPGTVEERNLGMFCTGAAIEQGRPIVFFQAGGGGWGDPLERDPAWVAEDIESELLSPTVARDAFGVVVTPGDRPWQHDVDLEATSRLRERLRRERGTNGADES